MFGLYAGFVAPAFASVTADLSPNANGFWKQWSLGFAEYWQVNEAVGCPGDANFWIEAAPPGDRQTSIIPLGSIPDGAWITKVNVIVCHSSTAATFPGGTFKTSVRVNGADTDSASNIVTGGSILSRSATTQSITPTGAPIVKSGATVVELGVYKTGSGNPVTTPAARTVWVYTLAGNLEYRASDLEITKSDSPDPVKPGQNLTYTIKVTNNGPDPIPPAENILVQDTLPAGLSVTTAVGDGSYNTGTNLWTIGGGLANGASASIVLTVPVPLSQNLKGGPLVNKVEITSSHPDTSIGNNSATSETQVQRISPLDPDPVPAMDPLALLLSALGLGLFGGRRLRRRG
jgi:uncharacterized repeat protein (TIGR01451 family)